MEINILHLLEGAKKAEGLTVVIDVFRAFTLEAYMYAAHAEKVIPTGRVEDAEALRTRIPGCLLAGERNGIKLPGFDYGNSPSELKGKDLSGKTVVHTTSAGVQGLVNAMNADEVLTGALVNASAVAAYIRKKNPEKVSLVAMGWNAVKDTEEDILCAEYIRSLLRGEPMKDIRERALYLRYQEGKKFFDPAQASVFPEEDFWMSVDVDAVDGVIRVLKTEDGLTTEWIPGVNAKK